MIAVGIDGFRARWFAVCFEDGSFKAAQICLDLIEAIGTFPAATAFAIDVPIGPPKKGVRKADELARKFVGPRRASVFTTPPLELVEAAEEVSYEDALLICQTNDAPGVSRQAFALLPKIREAAELARKDARVWEVHPEVSFTEMQGSHVVHPKKTWH